MNITIALPKGRLLDDALGVLAQAGLAVPEDLRHSRRLIWQAQLDEVPVRLLVIRAADVATFVERGAADCGIVGRDLLLEHRPRVYEPISLAIGRCRLCVAAPEEVARRGLPPAGTRIRVATKYGRIASEWFARRGVLADVIHLYGSIELAPLVGLADRIVDLVETGATLRANGLVEEATIAEISARWIVNPASWATKRSTMHMLAERLSASL